MRVLPFLLLLASGCNFFNNDNSNPLNGKVGDACMGGSDCRATLVCSPAGTCQPSGSGVEGSICQLSGDCMDGLYCGAGRTCETAGTAADGDACAETRDCERGLVCTIEGLGARCRPGGMGDLETPCSQTIDCLAGLACLPGSDGTLTCGSPAAMPGMPDRPRIIPWSGVSCLEMGGAARALFEVPRGEPMDEDFYKLPFPNDIRLTDSGIDLSGHPTPGDTISPDLVDLYLRAIESDNDGFSVNPTIFFRFTHPHLWDSVASNIRLVNVTESSPRYGQDAAVAWLNTFGDITRYICPNWLAIRTQHGAPLRPGETYAAIVTTGVVPDAGGIFERSPDLIALLGSSAPSDPALADAYAKYEPLRTWLTSEGIDPSTILNATVFTTESVGAIVPAMREVVRGRPAPALSMLTACDTGVTSPCDDGEERVCGAADPAFVEVHGRMELPIFQQGTPPYETPADGGGIDVDASGRPMVARTEQVCFALTVPRDMAPPADGFPLLITSPGTGGTFRSAVNNGLAAEAAAVGAATITVELPQHGERRGDSDRDPDGLVFNYLNPRGARDVWLQGAGDLLATVVVGESTMIDAGSSPTGQEVLFDPARIVLYAHSQGANHAALALPYEPDIIAAVLSGLGGDLAQSLQHKSSPVDIASVVPYAVADPDAMGHLAVGSFHPVLSLIQSYFDPIDTVNYARYLRREPLDDMARHVFLTYGLGDTYSPEETLRAFASAAGVTLVNPVLTQNSMGMPDTYGLGTADPPVMLNALIGGVMYTIGERQYRPGDGVDGHFVALQTTEGRADVLRFLTEALTGVPPSIGE